MLLRAIVVQGKSLRDRSPNDNIPKSTGCELIKFVHQIKAQLGALHHLISRWTLPTVVLSWVRSTVALQRQSEKLTDTGLLLYLTNIFSFPTRDMKGFAVKLLDRLTIHSAA